MVHVTPLRGFLSMAHLTVSNADLTNSDINLSRNDVGLNDWHKYDVKTLVLVILLTVSLAPMCDTCHCEAEIEIKEAGDYAPTVTRWRVGVCSFVVHPSSCVVHSATRLVGYIVTCLKSAIQRFALPNKTTTQIQLLVPTHVPISIRRSRHRLDIGNIGSTSKRVDVFAEMSHKL